MEDAELSLQLGTNWLKQARQQSPRDYLESTWRLYGDEPSPILESALLSHFSGELRLRLLELRAESERARQVAPEDLIRSGLLAVQLALDSLRHWEWPQVRAQALELAEEAMQFRLDRPITEALPARLPPSEKADTPPGDFPSGPIP